MEKKSWWTLEQEAAWGKVPPQEKNFLLFVDKEVYGTEDYNALYDLSPEETRPLEEDWRIEDLAVWCGFMPSKGQARKNGYCGEIKEGLHIHVFGKLGPRLKVFWTHKLPKNYKKDEVD